MVRLNPAVMRALDVLEELSSVSEPKTLRELTEMLGLPRTSAFELLNTLVARGYVARSESEPARYSLGIRTLQIGNEFANKLDYVALGREAAQTLRSLSDETSHVAILDGTDVVYIARAESRQTVRMISSIGSRVPAHCTAVGKALIAQLNDAEFDLRFPPDKSLAKLTDQTITDPHLLREQMRLIRDRGYSIEECESNPDVCCAAAAVRDHLDRVIAAISVSVPESRWRARSEDYWTSVVLQSAVAYSAGLGYTQPARNET